MLSLCKPNGTLQKFTQVTNLQHLAHHVCSSFSFSSSKNTHCKTKPYHCTLIKNGSHQVVDISNYLMTLYLKDLHDPISAQRLFDDMPVRDVRTWTILISGLTQSGQHETALSYFIRMRGDTAVAPNAFTLASVLKCCVHLNSGLRIGKIIHGMMITSGIVVDVPLLNATLDLYAKYRAFDCAKRLFELQGKDSNSWNIIMNVYLSTCEVDDCLKLFWSLPTKTVSNWNTIVNGLMEHGLEGKALVLLHQMVGNGITFDKATHSISLGLASLQRDLGLGKEIHCRLLRIGMNEDSFARTSLIDMYCKCGKMEKACILFEELQLNCSDDLKAQTVSWSTMIAGYVQNGRIQDALDCFSSMVHKEVEVDVFTLSSIFTACTSTLQLELGSQIHARILKLGHEGDVFLSSAMMDMYAKCGMLDDAWTLFTESKTRNVVLWTVMISSYAMHGRGRQAIQLFDLMIDEGVMPNEVSFVALLTACCHAGLLQEGRKYFRMMTDVYDIQHGLEHCVCMVDLYGRAGSLSEIERFIYEEGISCFREVWEAYLSSCQVHNDIEKAKWVSEKLLELDPTEADSYVVLSNAYSSNQIWDEASRLRGLMQERKVRKLPGQSWF